MLFWILAAIVLAVFTFIACLPLFRTKSGWTPVALALVFLLPVAALMIYKDVGGPEGIDVSGSPAGHASNSTDPTSDCTGTHHFPYVRFQFINHFQ